MISVIICSVNPLLLKQLKANIIENVGVPFEIIVIDNNIEKKSIAAVYNKAAGKAKFDCLCFVHEDVIIHSKDWGKNLIELLSDKRIGLAGISGAVYKSKYAGTWSACDKSLYRTCSIQHFKNAIDPLITDINPEKKSWAEVAVIDGVFLATTKEVFSHYQFDDKLLKGFHGYDIDYSLQVGSRYKVVVTYEILLEHFSSGNLNKEWLDNSLLVHSKWREVLPRRVTGLETEVVKRSDYFSNECVINAALKSKKRLNLILITYLRLILIYFNLNKLKYTKTVILYLLFGARIKSTNA